MDSQELERLYLLYKSGNNSEPDRSRPVSERQFTGDVLQIANATGPDLSEEDFAFIVLQIEALSRMRDNREPDSPSHLKLTGAQFQEKLWELPEYMQERSKPFKPKRDSQNMPVERSSKRGGQSSSASTASGTKVEAVAAPPVPAPPIVNPAEVRKALAKDAEESANDLPYPDEPKPGMIRVYHTGSAGDGSAMDKRWVTTTESYNYRPDKPMFYLDLPDSDPRVNNPDWPDQGVKQGFNFNFELEPHEAAKLKPMSRARPKKPTLEDAQADSKAWAANAKKDLLESVFGKKEQQADPSPAESAVGGATSQTANSSSLVDKLQNVLDAVGVVDPTPITDGVNMAISLGRAITDPGRAGTHLVNAATSAVSMVPYVGDLAKLGKFGARAASKEAGAAAKTATHGGTSSTMAGLAGTAAQMATVGGSGGAGSGGGGASPPGPPIDGSDGGGGGGGSVPTGGSIDWGNAARWAGIGVAIYAGFKMAMQQGRDLIGLLKPDGYTGNSFDSFKASSDRFDKTVDATMPLMKYTPFEQMRRAAVDVMKRVVDWLKSVEQEGDKMINANRKLAEYSGQVAVSFNQLDIDRIKRDISKADTMGGDFKNLSAAQSRFEAAKQDLFQPFERLQVTVQTGLLNLGTGLIKVIDSLEVVTEFIDWWLGYEKSTDARNGLEDAIQQAEQPPKKRL